MIKTCFTIALTLLPLIGIVAQDRITDDQNFLNHVYDFVGQENSEGSRIVVLNGKYGIVDKDMKRTVPLIYDKIEPDLYSDQIYSKAKNPFWIVTMRGKEGVITSDGTEVLPCKFKSVNKYGGFKGSEYNPTWVVVSEDSGTGIFDDNGCEIIPAKYYNIVSHGDYFIVTDTVATGQYEKYCMLYDRDGRMITHDKYTGGIDRLSDNLWRAYNSVQDEREGHEAIFRTDYGIINSDGEEIVPLIYNYIGEICEGLIAVSDKNYRWGYLDADSLEEAIKPQYDYAGEFSGGYANIIMDDKVGFINKEGKIVIPCEYDDISIDGHNSPYFPERLGVYEFYCGVTFVQKNGLFGLIDRNGEQLSPFVYKDVSSESLRWNCPICFEVEDTKGKSYFMSMGGTLFMTQDAAREDSYQYVRTKVAGGDKDFYELFGVFCYKRGEYSEAHKWILRHFANRGEFQYPWTYEIIGCMYEYGQGCEKNLDEALEWYKSGIGTESQIYRVINKIQNSH